MLVLLSGGRDSVCLLDLAVRIAGRAHVAALHCNYGLREAAGADERHCADLCERLGVELHVRRPQRPAGPDDPRTEADSPPGTGGGTEPASPAGTQPASPAGTGRGRGGGNLQAWARDARYGAAVELVLSRGGDIAAGHTASDQVETVLYRLAASPGRRALLGMAARDGRLVRPLLGSSREETAAHCTARGLAWREDASNDTPDFARNRVRNELLPALRSLHPAAEANVLRTLALLRDEASVLDAIVDDALAGAGDPPALAALRELPPALRRLALAATRGHRRRRERPGACDRAPRRRGDRARRGRRAGRRTRAARARSATVGCFSDTVTGRRRRAPTVRVHRMRTQVLRDPSIGEILVQADDLRHRVRQLGEEISRDYADKDLLLIGVLKGAVFFLADLMRAIDAPCEVDFMAVASYGSATESSGVVRILKDLDTPIEGRDVLIVEDIVDSGLTLQYLLRTLEARGPASLEVCALLTKPERRTVDLPTRYIGFEIPDKFAIGYGLDHAERYRNLPYVAALSVA